MKTPLSPCIYIKMFPHRDGCNIESDGAFSPPLRNPILLLCRAYAFTEDETRDDVLNLSLCSGRADTECVTSSAT
jgi:hypothetical protein